MDTACAASQMPLAPNFAAAGSAGVPLFAAPMTASSCGRRVCFVGLLCLVLVGIWLFWSPSRRPWDGIISPHGRGHYGSAARQQRARAGPDATAANPWQDNAFRSSERPFNEPGGKLPDAQGAISQKTGPCQNPQAPAPQTAGSGTKAATASSAPNAMMAQAPQVSGAMAGDGGWSLDASTFAPSQDSEEYYKHFKPVSLEATMPMGWRAPQDSAKSTSGEEDVYGEFSRYAITPNQMKRAENMRSVLRLGEISRDGLSRTLGQRSLLRDFVTPLGPNPVGDSAMLWNDSSVRQNYIASATGRFPEVAQSC